VLWSNTRKDSGVEEEEKEEEEEEEEVEAKAEAEEEERRTPQTLNGTDHKEMSIE
tara:strand:- start:177 stop:341 length:165 start_codon:yes stop_codon:yes gene_type:complete